MRLLVTIAILRWTALAVYFFVILQSTNSVAYLKKLKFNTGLNKLEKLKLKLIKNTCKDLDVVSWQLSIDRM